MMAWLSEKTFERLGDWISRSTGASQRAFDPLVKRLTPVEEPDSLDWAGDADWARLQQEPLRARRLLRLAAGVLGLLVIWAYFAELDEVTRGVDDVGRKTSTREPKRMMPMRAPCSASTPTFA